MEIYLCLQRAIENSSIAEFVFSTEKYAESNWCFSKEKSQAYHASYAVRKAQSTFAAM